MGCIGMGLDDFCRCTPSEFTATWEAWSEREQQAERGCWERLRMECLCMLQPWSKKRLEPRDVMELPWDESAKEEKGEELSKEEIKRRFRETKAALGLK